MFKKVLIANRGEIAVRIVRACQERGIRTVAVYSEVDRTALHVRYADEAYPIGPAPASESYLRIDRIIEVAKAAGVDAIHPGYGFLAENPAFAQACRDAGITFIGPSPEAIRAMGDKVQARKTMMAAGVPVVPGTEEGIDDEEALAAAEALGYPVLVKAAAGGGGKGMRTVYTPEELPRALQAARREAKAAFGDDRIYLEKLIDPARHVEIQILADSHGNVIHLGERECSIQRRHQKLIEEAPSTAVDEDLRRRVGGVAVRAARAVGYTNAGTVEFLLDPEGNFYFLEMNTRLQVEHPVTEMVTGVDIVKEQLAIAAGRRLRWRQEDIRWQGWAIECRITAEDPFNNFLPNSGKITYLQEPTGPGVRVESSLYEGMEVTLHYDPMLAKLIVWGETRAEAILRMRRALEEYRIGGIKTSIPFHIQVMNSTHFIAGRLHTRFLDNFTLNAADQARHPHVAAVAAALIARERERRAAARLQPQKSPQSPWRWAARLEALRR